MTDVMERRADIPGDRYFESIEAQEQPVETDFLPMLRSRLQLVQRLWKVKSRHMAEIAGYERSTWHRVLNDNLVNMKVKTLVRLSRFFGLPISFWFSPELNEDESFELPKLLEQLESSKRRPCACHDAAPFTQQIIKAAGTIGAIEKQAVLEAISDTDTIAAIAATQGLCPEARQAINAVLTDSEKLPHILQLCQLETKQLSKLCAAATEVYGA